MLGAGTPAEGKPMGEKKSIEARVGLLERAMSTVLHLGERDRYEIQALKAALAAVIDINRPEDGTASDQWFDAMLEVATRNAGLHAELAADEIIRDYGVDAERLRALEDERQAVEKWLATYFTGIKTPAGRFEGD